MYVYKDVLELAGWKSDKQAREVRGRCIAG